MDSVQKEDCKNIGNLPFIDWDGFRNTSFLVTGATGLIGSNLVNAIARNSQEKKLGIRLVLPVRDERRAREMFAWPGAEILPYRLGTKLPVDGPIDYIIHLASPTSSKFFTEQPADTLVSNIDGVRALLEWAKEHNIRKFVSLSTMEVYGFPEKGHRVKEQELGAFETMNARNSYPIAKIACEALCSAYYRQHGVPTVILRATQTFGPGVKYQDGRVFAEFMRCAVEKKNIVLKSAGLTERSYLYTADAVSAILTVLQKGEPGEAYTAANPASYCSIGEMAQMVADRIAGGGIQVVYDIAEDITKLGYAETLYMDLDTQKLECLGWYPTVSLQEMFERMSRGIEESK